MNETVASMRRALASVTEAAASLTHALDSTAGKPVGNGKPKPEYADIIVAVHGIGDQCRFATVRSVANRLAQSCELRSDKDPEPLAPQPLGYFHPAVRGATEVLRLDRFGDDAKFALAGVGFTEVFWADIPQQVDKEGATIEETKAWGRTIIARARAAFLSTRPANATEAERLKEPDFSLAAEVLDEIVETVEVLENLTFLADKAGVFRLDLHKVLNEYLGDVQIVTEFTQSRRDIVGRFQKVMSRIHEDYPRARLHIVAHSEGTVVSFLGLLHAMSRERIVPAEGTEGAQLETTADLPQWLRQVRGYMTLGSPIDKHLLLWPHLFDAFDLSEAQRKLPAGQIKWRNYYDYGDPVGFNLSTAQRWLKKIKKCTVFEFEPEHDIGFARYMLPGKAHNDYWSDAAVFEHFISEVIARPAAAAAAEASLDEVTITVAPKSKAASGDKNVPPAERTRPGPPRSRWWTYVLSPSVPYLLSAILLALGVFIFYRAVVNFMQPPLGPVQNYVRYMSVGVPPPKATTGGQLFLNALAVTALVAGTTLLSRWPRLTKEKAWWLAGGGAFALGCALYAMMPKESRDAIGVIFIHRPDSGSWLTLAIPLSLSLVAPWLPFTKGARRTLVAAGLVTVGILVWIWIFPRGAGAAAFTGLPMIEPIATLALLVGAFTLPWCGWRHNRDQDGAVRFRWWPALVGVALVAVGIAFYLRPDVRVPVDDVFRRWQEPGTYGTVCAALVVALIGMTSLMPPPRNPGVPRCSRRTRWFRKGMRPLILCGACAVAALVIYQAVPTHRTPPLTVPQQNEMRATFLKEMPVDRAREKANHVMNLITVEPPVWPIVLSGGAFLYLWWLSALIFDLAFVWQRYVRRSVANERLLAWREHSTQPVPG